MKTKILFLSLIFSSIIVTAQKEISSFSATGSGVATAFLSDYQCLGVNPANLGWQRNPVAPIHLSLLEGGASVYSDALMKNELMRDFIYNKKTHFTLEQKVDAALAFANNKFSMNADVAWLSFSYQKPKLGGFAFTVRERTTFNSYFNDEFAQLVFQGYSAPYFDSLAIVNGDTAGFSSMPKTLGELANGTKISGTWYREYVIGYGRSFISSDNFKLYAGIDVKYLSGYGILDIKDENKQLSGFSALSPFLNVSYANSTPSITSGSGMKSVGSGFGFDIGATVELFKKLKIGVALNDIGSITWDGNVYEAKDTVVNMVYNQGFYSFQMIDEIKKLIMDSTMFNWQGKSSHKVALPANMRIGVNYNLSERTSVGADCYIPVNDNAGSFDKAIIGVGANIGLWKFLTASVGVGFGGNYGFVVPLGFVVNVGDKWEIGIASRDAVTFFKKSNPTMSAALGFLRFNIGN
ncbi:MAG: hypothetical protein HXX09_03660 [Bacteroidetes bacterium]|nr:hypothetical protein [Bacteroidota bacterium]